MIFDNNIFNDNIKWWFFKTTKLNYNFSKLQVSYNFPSFSFSRASSLLPGSCFSYSSVFCPHGECLHMAPAHLGCTPCTSSALLSCSTAIPIYSPTFILCTCSHSAPSSTPGFTDLSSSAASDFFRPTYRSYCIIWSSSSTSAGHSP